MSTLYAKELQLTVQMIVIIITGRIGTKITMTKWFLYCHLSAGQMHFIFFPSSFFLYYAFIL